MSVKLKHPEDISSMYPVYPDMEPQAGKKKPPKSVLILGAITCSIPTRG